MMAVALALLRCEDWGNDGVSSELCDCNLEELLQCPSIEH